MRATISFDVEVNRVDETMVALVGQEVNTLHAAMELLENVGADNLLSNVSQALEQITACANQLQQYQRMVMSFERSRYETILPQTADTNMELTQAMAQPTAAELKSFSDLQTALDTVQGFESFMDPLTDSLEKPAEEDSEDNEEG